MRSTAGGCTRSNSMSDTVAWKQARLRKYCKGDAILPKEGVPGSSEWAVAVGEEGAAAQQSVVDRLAALAAKH